MASYKWTKWTDDVVDKFKEMYPTHSWEELLEEFPFKKGTMLSKACELGIRRERCKMAKYTKEEDEIIRSAFENGLTDDDLHSLLPWRTKSGIKTRKQYLNCSKRKQWTDEENDVLRRYYGSMPAKEIAEILVGRSENAIVSHANTMGLSGYKSYHEYNEEEYAFIKNNYKTMSDEDIADILGHPAESIKNRRNRLGLHRQFPNKTNYDSTYTYLRRHNTEWKKESMKECRYKCMISGDRFDDIHHLVSMNTILRDTYKRLDIDLETFNINILDKRDKAIFLSEFIEEQKKHPLGVCLRHDIHMRFHNEYGYGNNTPEQFYEFVDKFYPDCQHDIA